MNTRIVAVVMSMAILASGCSRPSELATTSATPAVVTPTPRLPKFSPEVRQKGDELEAARKGPWFNFKLSNDKVNGPAFAYLAATSEQPDAKVAALKAMNAVYRKEEIGEDYKLTVLHLLDSDESTVLLEAIRASGNAISDPPDDEVLEKVLLLATKHPSVGGRIEAFSALRSFKQRNENLPFVDALVQGLGDEPPVAATALFAMDIKATRTEKAGAVEKALTDLLGHRDPGVRGDAIGKFGEVYYEKPEFVLEKAAPMIDDPHPYVRGQAALALAKVRTPEAVALIMGLLDDREKTDHELPYEGLDREDKRVFGLRKVVAIMALEALQSSTFGKPQEEQFRYELSNDPEKLNQHVDQQVKKAQDWYAKVYPAEG